MRNKKRSTYYLPKPTYWPMIGSVALFCFFVGAANWLHQNTAGIYLFFFGLLLLIFMILGWFGMVIRENRTGLLNNVRVNYSFRFGMFWFIFTEFMFFAVFFAALLYARFYAVPFLGGAFHGASTHQFLWPHFQATWPLMHTPDSKQFISPHSVIAAWGIPAVNTLVLLSSGITITIARYGILKHNRAQMIFFQAITIFLGIVFVMMQAHEYWSAYTIKSLRLESGIYGTTFFVLTGFHALHVTAGIIALTVILWRMAKNDFHAKNYFGFEAVSWYWHFVDVIWIALFVIVYWI